MYSILSPLDEQSCKKIEQLRNYLNEKCSSLNDALTLNPHMSWLGAEELNVSNTQKSLDKLALTISPIHLETAGFGIFPGEKPVLYLPVIKTIELFNLHLNLWDQLSPNLHEENCQYGPNEWLPHISIFYFHQNQAESLSCALAGLIQKEFTLYFTIDRFRLAFYKNEQYGYNSEHIFAIDKNGNQK
jgi:hypothetical protein